eukprot:gene10866-12660_t
MNITKNVFGGASRLLINGHSTVKTTVPLTLSYTTATGFSKNKSRARPKSDHNSQDSSLYEYEPLAEDRVDTKEQISYFVFGDSKISEIVAKKKVKEVLTIKEHDLIINAVRKMVDSGVGSILVVNDKNHLKGIFTERDYVGKVALAGLSSRSSKVSEVMTTGVKTVSSDACVVDTMQIMTTERFRHLPVIDRNTKAVVGLVSIQDLIKSVHDNQKETIKYLREFLSDSSSYSFNKH